MTLHERGKRIEKIEECIRIEGHWILFKFWCVCVCVCVCVRMCEHAHTWIYNYIHRNWRNSVEIYTDNFLKCDYASLCALSLLLLQLLLLLLLVVVVVVLLLVLLLSFLVSFFFYTTISGWSLTGSWVTASLFRSPGLFSLVWLISILPDLSSHLWGPFQADQLHLV